MASDPIAEPVPAAAPDAAGGGKSASKDKKPKALKVEKPRAADMKPKAPKEKKPRALKAPKVGAAHPTYLQMIVEAISALKERTGSSQQAIAKFVEDNHKAGLPPNFKKLLSVQLKRLSQKGKLVQVKHSYKLSESLKKPAKPTKKPGAPAKKVKAVRPKSVKSKVPKSPKVKVAKTAKVTKPKVSKATKPAKAPATKKPAAPKKVQLQKVSVKKSVPKKAETPKKVAPKKPKSVKKAPAPKRVKATAA